MIERDKSRQDAPQNSPDPAAGGAVFDPEPEYSTLPENTEDGARVGQSEAGQTLSLPVGAAHVRLSLEVPEETCLVVEVEARAPGGRLLGRQSLVFGEGALPLQQRLALPGLRLRPFWRALAVSMPAALVWISFGLYILLRVVDLPAFPIYFFTDEAVQTVHAADLLTHHFNSPEGEFLPTFFQNGSQYNLSTSVYLQVLPYFLFGKSIWVTRGAAALMTLLAAFSVWLILKKVFNSPSPWLAVLFLSATPAWFLHSRTAFETSLACSLYAAFLYCYLMYRAENPRYLYPAVGFGALAFYTYSPMRMIMLVTALLLFLSDVRYHFKNPRPLLLGLALAALLALPYARFLINHPDASAYQMRLLGSYWMHEIPLLEKLDYFAGEYLHGLDPLYWYLPNNWDLPRHMMRGYGHLLRQTLPLGLLGVFLALRRVRQPSYRALLIAVLAVPSGSALVRLGLTRALAMVIPMSILTALAAQAVMDWLQNRCKLPRQALSLAVFLILAAANLFMLGDALINGPRWYKDYGLTGMQYGARQVFAEVADTLRAKPGTRMIVSPSWANGTDVVARFFFPDPLPFEMGSPDGYFEQALRLDENTLFVMIPEEYSRIPSSRFSEVKVEKTLPYPDGRPGFLFVRLKYVENIDAVLKAEAEEHRRPQTGRVLIGGQEVSVTYPRLDMNSIEQIFDGNPDSLARSWAINPMELDLKFPEPRSMQGLVLRVGGTATNLRVRYWPAGQSQPVEMEKTLPNAVALRDVTFNLPDPVRIDRLWISIQNTNDPPDGFVHLWEVTMK